MGDIRIPTKPFESHVNTLQKGAIHFLVGVTVFLEHGQIDRKS